MSPAVRNTVAREFPLIMQGRSILSLQRKEKTQTRRIVSRANILVDGHAASPETWDRLDFAKARVDGDPSPAGDSGSYLKVPTKDGEITHRIYPRWRSGDVAWVKEAWVVVPGPLAGANCAVGPDGRGITYRASSEDEATHRWKSPLFLPRWASRFTLSVLGVAPQRVQDITEEDAKAEGVLPELDLDVAEFVQGKGAPPVTYRLAFKRRWDEINGKRAPWGDNPLVWAIAFESLEAAR